MSRELYFLRSSEQKIVIDMFKYAHPNDPQMLPEYTEFYGFTNKDLGLYALVDNKIAGAIWSRRLDADEPPRLSVAIIPKFKDEGIGAFMMDQFLQEASALYETLCIDISAKPNTMEFYEKYGFEKIDESFLLQKKLEKKEVIRPTNGYDPTHWMD